MTQENKELLLKDLCARLPYGVKVQCEDYLFTFDKDHMGIGMLYQDFNGNPLESPKIILSGCYYGEDIKPYLFPLSSMTKEQKEFIKNKFCYDWDIDDHPYSLWAHCIDIGDIDELIDWFHKNHFDYRSLIEKGLAIDATGKNIY